MENTLKTNEKLIVIALGGNALQQKGEEGTIEQQFKHARESVEPIADLIENGHNVIITHGNGPQVGALMLMVDKSKDHVPETPLGVADAMTCGSIGYMISQSLKNELIKRNVRKNIVTLPAQVVVDAHDPAIDNPTKPIGRFYTEAEAMKIKEKKNWVMKEDAGRGFRRYVPSPYPIDIVEKEAICNLVEKEYVVITGGGGGIPVYYDKNGQIEGLDSVIDKDLASMKIALAVGAKRLVIVTGVEKVAVDFGKPEQKELSTLTLAEARYHLASNQFPAGSMGPKIIASIEFVQANPEHEVIITDIKNLAASLEGKAGTKLISY
jgi:carbamate kinase